MNQYTFTGQFWKCSKMTSWLGSKSEILIGKFLSTKIETDSKMSQFLIHVVVKFTGFVEFENLKNSDFLETFQF